MLKTMNNGVRLSKDLLIVGMADEYTEDREGLPLYLVSVQAGFPSPADDSLDRKLDLHTLLVKHPSATFFLRVSGDSMQGCGIFDGDLLVVDKLVEAVNGKVVIASVDNEFTVKRLCRKQNRVLLLPENPDYPAIDITGREHVMIWGVVTYCIHSL